MTVTVRTEPQDPGHGRSHGCQDVFAVVHDEEESATAGDLGAHLERQPGLAETADAGRCHEPVRTGEVRDIGDHLFTTDQ